MNFSNIKNIAKFHYKNNRWVAIGQSNIGKSHVELGIPCQDNIKIICKNNGLYCALCDGLGSKSKSDKGSEFVSRKIVVFLKNNFNDLFRRKNEEISDQIIKHLRSKITKELNITNESLEDYKTTLVFLAIKNGKYIAGSIGDSIIGLLKDGKEFYLSDNFNKRLEYANSTNTIFDDDASKCLHITKGIIKGSFDSAFMISDGLPFLANSGKIAPKLNQYIDMLKNTNYLIISDLTNKTLKKIVDSKKTCVDDWSYVFIKKVESDDIAKTYYTNNIINGK